MDRPNSRTGTHVRVAAAIATACAVLGATAVASRAADSAYPFPPGEHAVLAKQVCASCHDASLVIDRRYDRESARKLYRLFVGDPDSPQGRNIVEYLATALGEDK